MGRQIKFRGYNLKNKMWLYGYYLVNRGKHYIVQDEVVEPFSESSDFEVDPESVGQYVCSVNGVDLYEGDYVNKVVSYYYNGDIDFRFSIACRIRYDTESSQIVLECIDDRYSTNGHRGYVNTGQSEDEKIEYKVIGNEYEIKNK